MYVRAINDPLDLYGAEVNKDMISNIKDKLLPEIHANKQKIESSLSIVFVNGIGFKVKNKTLM